MDAITVRSGGGDDRWGLVDGGGVGDRSEGGGGIFRQEGLEGASDSPRSLLVLELA